jgi:hypothetical protein
MLIIAIIHISVVLHYLLQIRKISGPKNEWFDFPLMQAKSHGLASWMKVTGPDTLRVARSGVTSVDLPVLKNLLVLVGHRVPEENC